MGCKPPAPYEWHIALVSIWLLSSLSFCLERELVATVNPNCTHCLSDDFTLVHVRADGPNDTVHYFWGFNRKPALLLAMTSRETNLTIRWNEKSKPERVEFTEPPHYSFGVLLNRIFEFDDVNDTGFLNLSASNESYINKLEMPDVWKMAELNQNSDSVQLTVIGTWSKNSSVKSGSLQLQLEAFKMEDHGPLIPHLLHSSNATQIDFGMFNLVTTSGFQQSRYALELLIAANESSKQNVISNSFRSLDDEHTPGVFTLVDLQTSASLESGQGGYIQWRPVAYVAMERAIVNSTDTVLYNVNNVTNSTWSCMGTILGTDFGVMDLDKNLLKAVNISFGAKDDGFYAKTNMTFWTATIGYGHPPEDKFSMLVILIISVGLGLPALVIFFSFIYVGVRRISRRRDDLFLNR